MIRREFGRCWRSPRRSCSAELGWVTMGIVDTIMVGRLGADAIGAVGLASMLFFAIARLRDGPAARTRSAGRPGVRRLPARRVPSLAGWMACGWACSSPFRSRCHDRADASLDGWGLPPRCSCSRGRICGSSRGVCRRCCSTRRFGATFRAMGIVRPVMVALVAANVVNAFANWMLIFGHFGCRRWASAGRRGRRSSRVCSWRPGCWWWCSGVSARDASAARHAAAISTGASMRRLFALGFPAAGQAVLEVGVFAAATALAGRVSATALAAHQIALNMAAFTFMVPFGIASAAAVRVGHAVGRRDPHGARVPAGRRSASASAFMATAAVGVPALPRVAGRGFTATERWSRDRRRPAVRGRGVPAVRRCRGSRPARCADWAIRGRP